MAMRVGAVVARPARFWSVQLSVDEQGEEVQQRYRGSCEQTHGGGVAPGMGAWGEGWERPATEAVMPVSDRRRRKSSASERP